MTTQQLKSEILKAIDEMPDNLLPHILNYLERVKQCSQDDELISFMKQTLAEDKELLLRLSQ